MPTLHELFDAASDGLPPLPDLAPGARRIARRRQLATRTTAAVLSSALVVGAGTFVVSAQHPSSVVNNASGTPRTYDSQYVLSVLRSLWPIHNEHLELDSGYAIVIKEGDHEVGRMFFAVYPDVNKYPGLLGCEQGSSADTCVTATSSDGDLVLAETIEAASLTSLPAATGPATGPATSGASPSGSHPSLPGENTPARPGGMQRTFRLHSTYLGQLTMSGVQEGLPTNQQMLALVESPAYEQLIESAVAGSSFEWFGTPPAGVPSYSYGPSPSDSSGSATQDSLPPSGR